MANEKVLGLVSGTRDGKLLVVTTPTRCDPPATGEVYAGLVSGTRNGKPLLAFSTQRCGDTAGTLENGQTYLGLVSGTRDGKLLLAVPCGDCEPASCCNCENLTTGSFPATLPFTVTDSCFGDVWSGDMIDSTASYGDKYCDASLGVAGYEVAAAYSWSELTIGDVISTTETACSGASVALVDVNEYDKRDILVLCSRILCNDLTTYYHLWSVYYRRELINATDIKVVAGVKVLTLLSCDPLTFETEMTWDCHIIASPNSLNVPNSPITDSEAYCEDQNTGIDEPQYTAYQNCDGGTAQFDIG